MPSRAPGAAVVAICFAVVILDGYDLVVYGTVVPSLLQYEPWGPTAAEAGLVGSLALVGMAVGALWSGWPTDRLGRHADERDPAARPVAPESAKG